jgi:hypothetical protein
MQSSSQASQMLLSKKLVSQDRQVGVETASDRRKGFSLLRRRAHDFFRSFDSQLVRTTNPRTFYARYSIVVR